MLPVHILLIEEERRRELNEINLQRRVIRDASDPFAATDSRFVQTFRLTKEMVRYLFDRLIPLMRPSVRITCISPGLRILAALDFFATGGYQRSIGESFNFSMSQQSVGKAVREISRLICDMLGEWIVFPNTNENIMQVKARFMEKTNFPGVIGAIDCTHVRILCPSVEEHNYLNRKGYH